MLRKNDERRIRQIHRQIRILLHVAPNVGRVLASQIKDVESAFGVILHQFLLSRSTDMSQQQMTGFRKNRPRCDQRLVQNRQRGNRAGMIAIIAVGQGQPKPGISDGDRARRLTCYAMWQQLLVVFIRFIHTIR